MKNHMTWRLRGSGALLGACLCGCAMSNLEAHANHDPPTKTRREICQAYADDSASFIGFQQGLGVVAAVGAAGTGAFGVVLPNDSTGDVWQQNRKTFALASTAVLAILAYNFLDNAKSASTSAAAASNALADPDDEKMWEGCQRARAAYFDGRTAGITRVESETNQVTTTVSKTTYDRDGGVTVQSITQKAPPDAGATANELFEAVP